MAKGYTTPTGKQVPSKGMPIKQPDVKFKAPDLTKRVQIPTVRPTSMRNLGPWSGFNNDK